MVDSKAPSKEGKSKKKLLLVVLNLLAVALIAFNLYAFYSDLKYQAKQAVYNGQRVEVSIHTGQVKSRDKVIYTASDMDFGTTEEEEEAELLEEGEAHEGEHEDALEGEHVDNELPANPQPEDAKPLRIEPPKSDFPKVAIIVSGVGLNEEIDEMVRSLITTTTLSYSPYSEDISAQIERSFGLGYEVFLDLPLEDKYYPFSDPGIYGLLKVSDNNVNRSRFSKMMNISEKVSGIIALPDEQFTPALSKFIAIIDLMQEEGVTFVYKERKSNELIAEELRSMAVRAARNYVHIDEVLTKEAIASKLQLLEEQAKERGGAIGVIRAYPISINILQAWMKESENKGLELMHVTSMIKHFTEKEEAKAK